MLACMPVVFQSLSGSLATLDERPDPVRGAKFDGGAKERSSGFGFIWPTDHSHPCAGVGVRCLCCCTREAAGRANAGSDKRRNLERHSGSKKSTQTRTHVDG